TPYQPILIDEAIDTVLRITTIGVSDTPAFKLGGMHAITNNQAPTCPLIHHTLLNSNPLLSHKQRNHTVPHAG
ncbi:MAG: hypothetical protein L0K08_05220, partial [Bifidobacterium mongoliense]|nr:hypothetical protein [Bifidobacterium mongoliense]